MTERSRTQQTGKEEPSSGSGSPSLCLHKSDTPKVQPFEQQPGESLKAFSAFKAYLDLGDRRSLVALAEKLQKSRSLLERWSSKYGWPSRVLAYYAHLAEQERAAATAVVQAHAADWAARQQEHKEEEWRLRCELVELAREAIRRWKADPRRCGSLEGMARLLDLASRLGRLSSGLPTESTESTVEFQAALDPDWEAALRKAYGPKPAEVIDITGDTVQATGPVEAPSAISHPPSPISNS